MSFVTVIKDYIDLLNNTYSSISNDLTFQELFPQTFFYLFSTLKFLLIYVFSFQWIKDLIYLPVLVPQISSTILKENYFLDTPLSNFFTLLEIPSYENNKFMLGFLNSFFLALPLSTSHFISARRLLVQGVPAGIASSFGTVIGQSFFFFCVLFGLRLFIIPWFSYEPFSYVLGIFLTIKLIYHMAYNPIRKISSSQKLELIQIFLINFLLSWTEQSSIFQYFGNLTLGPEPSIFESFASNTTFGSNLSHSTYLIGILLGNLFFTGLFTIICLQLSDFSIKISAFTYSRWLRKINFAFLSIILAFTFASIPFYSLDYIFAGPLGFISQDKALNNTIFSSKNLPIPPDKNIELSSMRTDITPFDRGRYLQPEVNTNFEDLNYQGEYAWTSRQDRQPSYRAVRARRVISSFFQKNKKNSTRGREIQESSQSVNKSDPQEKNLSSASYQEKSNLPNTDSTLSLKNGKALNNNEILDDFDDFDDFEDSNESRYSEYFFKLNDNLNKELKVTEVLAPVLDASFSNQFLDDASSKNFLEKTIKQKYYLNPVYKTLLNADIDLFLRNQPSSYLLSPQEEKELFEKRLILSNYYDSLRYYEKLPYAHAFRNLFNGSKSYADRVYNQQFKGTLKVVRRLFLLNLNEDPNSVNKIVLKFDQPLYKKSNQIINSRVHEELILSKQKKKPFIKLTNPTPFYTGWDENLRKLVITNRLLPRSMSGYTMQFNDKFRSSDSPTLTKLIKKTKKIDFTMWPLTQKFLEEPKSKSKIPYNVLYEKVSDLQNVDALDQAIDVDWEFEFETVPPNLAKIDPNKLNEVVPPTRGGFIWPGHSYLKLNLKNLLFKKF